MPIDQARQEIQRQKELPTLSPDIERILSSCENPDISQAVLAEILGESPTISARLLGLANSSFFGQQGKVLSLSHAISVLGMVTVRSVAVGLALSGVFKTERCPHFQVERYWSSAVITALMSTALYSSIHEKLRPQGDTVYMTGLLHNIGILVLVHLYPEEMDQAFAAYEGNPERSLADHIHDLLAIDHYQAGIWLGSKWHLPENILLVMKHHYDRTYRGESWPLVQLIGVCSRWAGQVVDESVEIDAETDTLEALGIPVAKAEQLWVQVRNKLDAIRDMAALFGKG